MLLHSKASVDKALGAKLMRTRGRMRWDYRVPSGQTWL